MDNPKSHISFISLKHCVRKFIMQLWFPKPIHQVVFDFLLLFHLFSQYLLTQLNFFCNHLMFFIWIISFWVEFLIIMELYTFNISNTALSTLISSSYSIWLFFCLGLIPHKYYFSFKLIALRIPSAYSFQLSSQY